MLLIDEQHTRLCRYECGSAISRLPIGGDSTGTRLPTRLRRRLLVSAVASRLGVGEPPCDDQLGGPAREHREQTEPGGREELAHCFRLGLAALAAEHGDAELGDELGKLWREREEGDDEDIEHGPRAEGIRGAEREPTRGARGEEGGEREGHREDERDADDEEVEEEAEERRYERGVIGDCPKVDREREDAPALYCTRDGVWVYGIDHAEAHGWEGEPKDGGYT